MYQKLSGLINMMGEMNLHQGYLINNSLNIQTKYQREQAKTSFKEAYALVKSLDSRL
jgi:hypothetical protein